jgi:hypothetical protein
MTLKKLVSVLGLAGVVFTLLGSFVRPLLPSPALDSVFPLPLAEC